MAYPPLKGGSAPGVATTRAGSAPTAASTVCPPEVWTVTPGKARPSSSAVRREPTIDERSEAPSQAGQRKPSAPRGVPHHRQAGARPAPGRAIGPWQAGQRTGSRQCPHASEGR